MIKALFGQYVHKNSFMHNLDPRLKLIYVFIISILIFMIKDSFKILIFSFFIIIIILLAKLNIKNLVTNLKPFFFIFVFIFIMYVIFSRNQLEQGIIVVWRFLMLIIVSLILTFTTTISNIVAAIEKLLKPLKILDIKTRNIAVMISITIRFVPVMFINLEKLREAMLSRLANFRKIRHIKLILIALFEKMLKSAYVLSDAMQSRLYNENIESHKIMRLSKNDYVSVIFIYILMFILIIY